uniref:Ionotropic glutamate receptor C-terminal domain-containing protein n=1 Tax=Stomoxys calcitrans TaxID=35570 RepID=A0A1I8Q4R1_STOCA
MPQTSYQSLLLDIYKEKHFDSLLLLHSQHKSQEYHLQPFLELSLPKVIMSENQNFTYCDFYNSEILVIFFFTYNLDLELLQTGAETIDFMRQKRVLMLAENVEDEPKFLQELLLLCESYKMTNAFVVISDGQHEDEQKYFLLKPYAAYHWVYVCKNSSQYFNQSWRNYNNKTLRTFIDQSSAGNLVYVDAQGNLQLNGFIAQLVLLFAELHNASLSMLHPLQVGDKTHFQFINQMVMDNLLDVPMSLTPIPITMTRNGTDFYDINQIMILVPLAQRFTVPEIFGVLVNEYFFACILLTSLMLSMVHGLIDYLGYDLRHFLDLLINSKVLPGILGLSFSSRTNPRISLKIVYILVGFAGLYLSTLFAATNNTLFTSPPSHQEIRTFQDLRQSPIKLLYARQDVGHFRFNLELIEDSLELSDNLSYIQQQRINFNPSYGYGATSTTFDIVWRQQKFWSRPTFHAPKDMVLFDLLPWGYLLQYNSPYKDDLNSLIHRVHAAGLVEAWRNSLFSDLLKLKQVSIKDRNPPQGPSVFTVVDLFWIWMIGIIGLSCSTLVMFLEYFMGCRQRRSINSKAEILRKTKLNENK